MRPRPAVIGLGALLSLMILSAIVAQWAPFEPPAPNPAIHPAPIGPAGWKETRRYSVNRVLIVEGESLEPHRAEEIARAVLGTGLHMYDEALVYVRQKDRSRPSTPLGPSTWRVQWTKAEGFRVLAY